MNTLKYNKELLLQDKFYHSTIEPHKFIVDHYKELSNDLLCKFIPATSEYIDAIIEIKEKGLDEGEYLSRQRKYTPNPYIAETDVDWDNPTYEKFLFVNYDNFDWIDLRKKFWIAHGYWVKVEDIKKHTPQSDMYGIDEISGEFEDYE